LYCFKKTQQLVAEHQLAEEGHKTTLGGIHKAKLPAATIIYFTLFHRSTFLPHKVYSIIDSLSLDLPFIRLSRALC